MRVLITGASRGIGAAVARQFAKLQPGCHLALLGRSLDASSRSHGSLLGVAERCEDLGASATAFPVDHRSGEDTRDAIKTAIFHLGGIDVLVNNASCMWTSPVASPDKMDDLWSVNTKTTLVAIQEAEAPLRTSKGSIVTMSPPLRMCNTEWIRQHPAFTVSKYGMSIATLAAASSGVRANCLWPRHFVATEATRALEHTIPGAYTDGRPPEDVALAVYVLAMNERVNCRTLMDDEVIPMPPTAAPLSMFANERPPKFPTSC